MKTLRVHDKDFALLTAIIATSRLDPLNSLMDSIAEAQTGGTMEAVGKYGDLPFATSDFKEPTEEQLADQPPQQLELPLDDPNETILQEAQRLVCGARQRDYAHPLDNGLRIAQMWEIILGFPGITPQQVMLCMAAVKIARQIATPKRDNLVDLAGYALCAQMATEEEERRAARVA